MSLGINTNKVLCLSQEFVRVVISRAMDKIESDSEIIELKESDCKASFIPPGRGIKKKQAEIGGKESDSRNVLNIDNGVNLDKDEHNTVVTSLNRGLKKAGKRLNEMLDKLDAKLTTTDKDSDSVDS